MANAGNVSTVFSAENQQFLSSIETSKGALKTLLKSIDPLASATADYNRQVDLLDKALRSGTITQEQFARSNDVLRTRFQQTTSQMTTTTTATGSMRAGMQQLSFQLNDVATGLTTGTPPLQVFAQQISQVTQALQMMTTSTSGFLGFLAGPWGAAITAATVLLAGLAAKYFDGSAAAEAKEKAAKSLKSAIDSLGQSTERQIGSENRLRAATLGAANALLAQAAAARQAAGAELNRQLSVEQSLLNSANSGLEGGETAAVILPGQRRHVQSLRQQLSELKAQEANAANAVNNIKIGVLQAAATVERDKGAAATTRYQLAQDRLNDAFKRGDINGRQYKDQFNALTAQYDTSTEALKKHGKASDGSAKAAREAAKEERERKRVLEASIKATQDAAAAQQQFLDRIFPDQARKRQLEADSAEVGRLLTKGLIDPEAWRQAQEGISGELDKVTAAMATRAGRMFSADDAEGLWKGANDAIRAAKLTQEGDTRSIADSYESMSQRVVGSLQNLSSAIKGGDFLSILSGVIDAFSSIAGTGLLGKGLQTRVAGARAGGGFVNAGMPYFVGEKRPEIFVPDQSGRILPDAGRAGGRLTVRVIKGDLFDVIVEQQASGVVERAAPGIAAAGASGGVAQVRRIRDRSLVPA